MKEVQRTARASEGKEWNVEHGKRQIGRVAEGTILIHLPTKIIREETD